jgi:hypothetical protein
MDEPVPKKEDSWIIPNHILEFWASGSPCPEEIKKKTKKEGER